LEIVLNEVSEQACLATGATGAAIVLRRNGEMICRASSGSNAPQLGSRLDAASGLSGECIRTRRTQRCDDVLEDPRVDREASQRLGVRSLMVIPLVRGSELAGVFELFSSVPRAFGERDELTLEALASRILSSLERATQPVPPENKAAAISSPVSASCFERQEIGSESESNSEDEENSSRKGFDWISWSLGGAVLACAALLGIALGRHVETPKTTLRPHLATPSSAVNAVSSESATVPPPVDVGTTSKPQIASPSAPSSTATTPSTAAKHKETTVPPGSLVVFENGKEVFRMAPGQKQAAATSSSAPQPGSGTQSASSIEPEKVMKISPAAVAGNLLHRVEPEYPEAARQQRIQGAVVVDVHIGRDGAVQDVQTISGPPLLAQASLDAVKQWRFKPRSVNGRPTEMQTRITLNFKLPQ
jgi:TonB family protein